jgi:rfaE bifunctional protein nucleotidyltransferase chain/domain
MADIIPSQTASNYFKENKQEKIVVAGGCFDLLHIGHVTLLENAKKQGDLLVVLIESDSSIKKKKGINRPIHTQKERAQLVGALKAVDVVILLSDNMQDADYDALLHVIKPAILATTDNDPYISRRKKQAEKIGAKVVAVNTYNPRVSTTKLLDILSKES